MTIFYCRVLFVGLVAFFVAPSTALSIQGEWQQGGMLQGLVHQNTKVKFLGRSVRVSDEGIFVIGLGRDAPEKVELTWIDAQGVVQSKEYSVRQRRYDVQRIEGVKKEHVTPPENVLQRIREEAVQVRQARQKNDARLDFINGFDWPLVGPITGVYGSQRIYNGVPKSPHYGVDIAAPIGTPVMTPAPGVVSLVHEDMYYSGGTLIIDHGHGISSTFIHLSKILVEPGQLIKRGDVIAEVGQSGRATGPHLDWRINWFNQRLDPQLIAQPVDAQ